MLEGNEIISIDDYDVLYSYYDCWKCTTERHNAVFQGIVEADGQTENAITGPSEQPRPFLAYQYFYLQKIH